MSDFHIAEPSEISAEEAKRLLGSAFEEVWTQPGVSAVSADKRPRLLAVTHALDFTGAPLILFRLLRSLTSEYRISVLSLVKPGPLKPKLEACGIEIVTSASPNDYDVALCSTILTSKIVSQIAALIPTIWWIHEPAFGVGFITAGKVELKAFDSPAHIVFPTEWQAHSMYAPWLGKSRWSVVPYGIEMKRQGRDCPFPKKDEYFNLVQLGSIEHRKGQDLTIKAARLLKDPKVRVFFLGRMPPAGLHIEPEEKDRLIVVGSVDEEVVAAYLEHADAMIFPTRDDLVTLSILEAMSVGTCVLSSDYGPIPKALSHGRTALLSPVDDFHILAGNIAMLKRDSKLRADLARRGHEFFQRTYTFAKHRQSMIDVLKA